MGADNVAGMATKLTEEAIRLASGPNFAVLSTLLPDGTPQSHVMWVDTDGENLLLNTEAHRRKARNLERDPRATVTLIDRDDPYRFVEVRGRMIEVVEGPAARDHIDRLSRKYLGKDYSTPIRSHRIMLVVQPERVVAH